MASRGNAGMMAEEICKLVLQRNGLIIEDVRSKKYHIQRVARDLRFAIDYLATNDTWVRTAGEFADEQAAREALAGNIKRMSGIHWRLVAFNDFGSVPLPNRWQGYKK